MLLLLFGDFVDDSFIISTTIIATNNKKAVISINNFESTYLLLISITILSAYLACAVVSFTFILKLKN